MKKIICLGIESSCDETAAAVVDSDKNILSHVIYSQAPEHREWGGVVPELAARAHILAIDLVAAQALRDAGMDARDIDIIAATAGPGLIGGVIVGWEFAAGLAMSANKPLIAVNHLEGHALVPRLRCESDSGGDAAAVDFPYLLLLASGGHTQTLIARGVGRYELLGQTLDDSAGEAFDKVAKMLGLGYPGGPAVEREAAHGNPKAFRFPRPLCGQDNLDFSFSGIKTAVRMTLGKTPDAVAADICASFQQAVIDAIIDRLGRAIARAVGIKTLVAAGGVAANRAIRGAISSLAAENGMRFAAPPIKLCADNGAMIAWAGIENYLAGNTAAARPTAPRPRWPLEELAS